MKLFASLLKLARPHQYVKNAFVFLGPIFGGVWSGGLLVDLALAFAAFCAIASAVYVVNDIFDVEADRAHPIKCKRPIASGAVSLARAWTFAGALGLLALLLSGIVGGWALFFILFYAAMNLGYTLRWKHVVVIDVFLISLGFMLRIMMGTVGLGIPPSSWLLLCGLMVTLFLGFAKRRAELILIAKNGASDALSTRKVLENYSAVMIEQYMSISAACAILAYSLYTMAPETVAHHGTTYLILTVPFVIYGIFRYLYLLHGEQYGADASREIFADPHLLATGIGWTATVVAVLALRP